MSGYKDWRTTTAIAGVSCIVLFFAILFGTRSILDNTIRNALIAEASRHAGHLEQQIVRDFPELAILASKGRTSQDFRARLEKALSNGHAMLQLKVYNVRGRLRYVFDETRWFENGGDIQSDVALNSVASHARVLEILRPGQGHLGDGFISRATQPLYAANGEIIGAFEVTQDQTEIAQLYVKTFRWLTIALPVVAALLFFLPALAWLILHRRNGRNEVLVQDLARRDRLTGLMNRSTFTHEANQVFEVEISSAPPIGILIVDIDHFRLVNDALGHKVADALLKHVASVISGAVRRDDFVARFGGDEFVALLPDVAAFELQDIANRIFLRLGHPFRHGNAKVAADVSIGTYLSQAGDTLDDAMHAAELAQARAKEDGRNRVVAYTASLDRKRERRREIEAALRDAWDNDRAHLVYQPVIATKTGNIAGFEALMRLRTHADEPISPEEFIPIAEETGMIRDLGIVALRRAMKRALDWPRDTFVAVNLSPAQFQHGDLVEQVRWMLEELKFQAERLEIEITESLLLSEDASVKRQFTGLKDLGVSIAMDDFGTGYSSLSYLLAHDFDKLKIDRMFLGELHGAPERHRNVLRSIITLGRQIGMKVTAEGVETSEQKDLLTSMGCDLLQGFYFHRPMPGPETLEQFKPKKLGGAA